MQKLRMNDAQLLHLAAKARQQKSSGIQGFLLKRSPDSGRWQPRYFVLYQNLLFHYENERSERPLALTMLEICRCERIKNVGDRRNSQSDMVFSLTYKSDGQKCLDLRADNEAELNQWMGALEVASFCQVLLEKNELEQRHLHLLHVLDSERQAKWQYVQQTELLASEVKQLKNEVASLKDSRVKKRLEKGQVEETEEIRKIKKVQSFIRGWMCRRRWKQIVAEYINSEHAESMRKRNSVVFGLVEWEKEYVSLMSKLATCFLRPFRMMASAKKPIISHEDVNSIFLNAETVLFLHQIFLQGLNSKIDNWPTLQLGDIFDILLPMLGIYHEYVRNHHYSLQVLAEYKQKPEFAKMLLRCEEKPACEERSLETFLTYPMYQIPHYIRTLTELLAHTPHDHVDRKQLEYAKRKLEELSHVMHDEVSETENIRKNLAIERMIVEGCNVLLDVNQIFVRQGSLIQTSNDKQRPPKSKLSSIGSTFKESKKEVVRQCFLFTNHLLITTRASSGRLHLLKNIGEVALAECTLIEDTQSSTDFPFVVEDDNANQEVSMVVPDLSKPPDRGDYNGLDFRIIITPKDGSSTSITLVASTPEEKNAWCTDLTQCIEQNRFAELLTSSISDSSSVALPHTIRSDPSLYRDDVDIKLSRTLNSCKIPQIRHASVPRLLNRLTDIRFLSIDYLNTFLMMYPVFTDSAAIMKSFRRVLTDPDGKACAEKPEEATKPSSLEIDDAPPIHHRMRRSGKHRRISTGTVPGDVRRRSVEAEDDQMSLMSEIIESHWSSEEDFIISANLSEDTTSASVNIEGCTLGETSTDATSLSVTSPEAHESSDETIRQQDEASLHLSQSKMLVCGGPNSVLTPNMGGTSIMAVPHGNGTNNQIPSSLDSLKSGSPPHKARPGTVVTSSRQSKRRCSNLAAAQAFAVATAGSAHRDGVIRGPLSMVDSRGKRFSVINAATAMRVLNILRQWLMRFPEDFEQSGALRQDSISLAEDLVVSQVLVMAENRAAARVLKQLKAIEQEETGPDIAERVLIPKNSPSDETFESLAALDIAEQMTYLDHQLFRSIRRQEFHSLAWMKEDKNSKAKHILLVSKRFNEVSRLVVSEIVSRTQQGDRVACIEKWVAVADMCRFMHNYNGVLQICAALVNSAVFRLKRTWEKVSKTARNTLDKLQNLVSSDGRFKNLREALHSCDPPCIPYLGMYLTDLSFIEEGSPDFTETDHLVNFCKMRMVAHVIQEIQQYQQHTYRIQPSQKVIDYLLDTSRMLSEGASYTQSLSIEPRQVLHSTNE